jgi:hypothetical protein
MEVSKLDGQPIEAQYTLGKGATAEVLNMELNPDVVTKEFLDEMAGQSRGGVRAQMAAVMGRLQERLGVLSQIEGNKPEGSAPAKAKGRRKNVAGQPAEMSAQAVAEALAELTEALDQVPNRWSVESAQCEFYARTLDTVVLSWDMTDKGIPVEPNYGFFIKRPKRFLEAFFNFCVFEAPSPKAPTAAR